MRCKMILLLTLWIAQDAPAWADGGVVRFSERRGERRITVFTAPTPLQVGPTDVSVLIQDAASGKPLTAGTITVFAHPVQDSLRRVSAAATSEAATNKLMRAAPLDLAEPGWWHVDVIADGATIGFDMEVGAAPPAWLELLPWIGWPFVVIGIYGFRQWLGQRRAHFLPMQ